MSLTSEFRKSITAKDLTNLDIEKLDKFNFDLLGELSECLSKEENVVDTLNRMKFLLDTKKDLEMSVIVLNLCFLVVTEIVDKMKVKDPDDIDNKCSLVKTIFQYYKVLSTKKND